MKQPGLFGDQIEMNYKKPVRGHYVDWKRENNYRKGSLAKCCKWCVHKTINEKYYKCDLMGDSASAASDIRLFNVCDNFKE